MTSYHQCTSPVPPNATSSPTFLLITLTCQVHSNLLWTWITFLSQIRRNGIFFEVLTNMRPRSAAGILATGESRVKRKKPMSAYQGQRISFFNSSHQHDSNLKKSNTTGHPLRLLLVRSALSNVLESLRTSRHEWLNEVSLRGVKGIKRVFVIRCEHYR